MRILTVEDISKFKNRKHLVIVEFLRETSTNLKGERRGYHPKEALELFQAGKVKIVRAPSAAPTVAQVSGATKAAGVSVKVASGAELDAIVIPEDFERLHPLKLQKLAAMIEGVDMKMIPSRERAIEIIAKELERRAGEAAPQSGGDTDGGQQAEGVTEAETAEGDQKAG